MNQAYQPLLFSSDGGAIAPDAVRSPARGAAPVSTRAIHPIATCVNAQQVPAITVRLLHLATHAEVKVNPFSAHTGDVDVVAQRDSHPLPMLRMNLSAAASQSPTAKGSAPMHAAQQALRYVPPAPHTGRYDDGHLWRQASMRAAPADAAVAIAAAGAGAPLATAPSRRRRCARR